MFYETFAKLCAERNTSPSAVTKKIGLSNSTATGWKKNGTIPKREILEKLAKELHCEPEDFFPSRYDYAIVSLRSDDNKSTTVEINDDIRDFLFIYDACTNRQRNQLMSMVYDFEQKVLNP